MQTSERLEPTKIDRADIKNSLKQMATAVVFLLYAFCAIEFMALLFQIAINGVSIEDLNLLLLVHQITHDGKILKDSIFDLNTFYAATLIAAYAAFSRGQLHKHGDLTFVIRTIESTAYLIITINIVALVSQITPPINSNSYRVNFTVIFCMLFVIIISTLGINLAVAPPDHELKHIFKTEILRFKRDRAKLAPINLDFKKLIRYQITTCILATIFIYGSISHDQSGRAGLVLLFKILCIFGFYQGVTAFVIHLYAEMIAMNTSRIYQIFIHISFAGLVTVFSSICFLTALESQTRENKILLGLLGLASLLITWFHILISSSNTLRAKLKTLSALASCIGRFHIMNNRHISNVLIWLITILPYFSSFHIFTSYRIKELDLQIENRERKLSEIIDRINERKGD